MRSGTQLGVLFVFVTIFTGLLHVAPRLPLNAMLMPLLSQTAISRPSCSWMMREYPPELNTVLRVDWSQNMRDPLYGATLSATAEKVDDRMKKTISNSFRIVYGCLWVMY